MVQSDITGIDPWASLRVASASLYVGLWSLLL